jgi:hypothetical protein
MSKSPFRPSDDAATFPFPVAANAMASVALADLAAVMQELGLAPDLAARAGALAADIAAGIAAHGVAVHPQFGSIYAYEVDGFSNALLSDDANLPSLLGLPLLGFCARGECVVGLSWLCADDGCLHQTIRCTCALARLCSVMPTRTFSRVKPAAVLVDPMVRAALIRVHVCGWGRLRLVP